MAHFDRHDTLTQVIGIIAHKLNIDQSTLDEGSQFQTLGADSLDMVEIVMKFEEAFGIEIEDSAADQLSDIRSTVDYIQAKRTR